MGVWWGQVGKQMIEDNLCGPVHLGGQVTIYKETIMRDINCRLWLEVKNSVWTVKF